MAVSSNDLNILREWAPLTDLLNKLPTKIQTGIFSQDVQVTCIDVLPEFIALGSNLGTVYWYDRKNKEIKHLYSENKVHISVVQIISTVDYMVACGNKRGNINIFQIPKSHPDSIPECLKPKNKNVERYSVSDLHRSEITAIEWSKNGMKLFSGDKTGSIVLTEIDFYMHICKSREIINETYEVVQLSYNQQRLLVSTTYRSIICKNCGKWQVCQVGRKDRKILGQFGGIICQNGLKSSDTCLYCTRPGVRIWIADVEGAVQKTILFKDILSKECSEVPIINPISRNLKALKPQKEPSFGIVLPFNDNLLVTYSNDVVYILDPDEMAILATISHLRRILWVATCKDEIFILEGERSIIRISYKPETAYVISPFVSNSNPLSPITLSIKDLTNKIQTTSIIAAIPPFVENSFTNDVNVHTDNSLIMNAEEAKESPIKLRNNSNPEIEKKFNAIGKQQFNDKILYKQNKHRKKSGMSASTISLSSNSSEETYLKPTLMNLSSIGVLPDLRSPESIQNDIEYKEKILAEILNLDRVKISLDNLQGDKEEVVAVEIEENHVNIQPNFVINSTIPLNYDPPPSSSQSKVLNNTIPACLNIPNDWKLSDIQLNMKNDTSLSDNSLNDWELV